MIFTLPGAWATVLPMRYILVYITAGDREEALRLAEALVGARLAACANILGAAHSIYWWEGKVERGEETVLVLKSRRDKFAELLREARRLHSYATPCIVALPIVDGNPDYLDWIDASCSPGPGQAG